MAVDTVQFSHRIKLVMDEIIDDEKKPFDAETANDDDAQPDPDEHLMLDQGNGRVWLIKVPIMHRRTQRSFT